MPDQLVGWLGQADAVLTAAIPVVKHLREIAAELGALGLSGYGAWCALRRPPRGSGEGRKVPTERKRLGRRRPRPNNRP